MIVDKKSLTYYTNNLWAKINTTFVRQINGKDLSTEDYTTEDKNKIYALHTLIGNEELQTNAKTITSAINEILGSSIDGHLLSNITDENGVHNIRYNNNNLLQVNMGGTWNNIPYLSSEVNSTLHSVLTIGESEEIVDAGSLQIVTKIDYFIDNYGNGSFSTLKQQGNIVLDASNYSNYCATKDHTHSQYSLTSHTHSGYASSSHTHSYLPLSGGTVTGNLTVSGWFRPNGSLYLLNGCAIRGYIAGNTTYYNLLYISSTNNVEFNTSNLNLNLYGKNINLNGNNISLKVNSGGYISFYSAVELLHQFTMGTDVASDGKKYYINNNGTGRFNILKYEVLEGISSKRYKNNIEYKNEQYWHDKLMQIKPCTFYYNNDNITKHIGLVAEDLVDLIPELVGLDEEGLPASIEYANLTIPLISEVQRLNQIVEKQQTEIEILKSKIS